MGDIYWIQYGNSAFYAVVISTLAVLTGFPMGYAMVRWKGKVMKGVFWGCCMLILLPFQVTMLPTYILLDHLKLLNTMGAIILPGMVSPLTILLMWLGHRRIPLEYEEAFRMESNSLLYYFCRILLPEMKWSVLVSIILNFSFVWNMVDQALVFLENRNLWPLSLGMLETEGIKATTVQVWGYLLPVLGIMLVVFYALAFFKKCEKC